MTNSASKIVRDVDQPLRQSKSANIMETSPVNKNAQEKNRKIRQLSCRGGAGETESEGVCPPVSFGVDGAVSAMRQRCVNMKKIIRNPASAAQSSAMRK